jgi:hypothetical protein
MSDYLNGYELWLAVQTGIVWFLVHAWKQHKEHIRRCGKHRMVEVR